jgi:hypothetical protein
VIIPTHNANIRVNGDAERVIAMDNDGTSIRIRDSADKDDATRRVAMALPCRLVAWSAGHRGLTWSGTILLCG